MALIPFETLIRHGKAATKIQDGLLELTSQSSVTSIAYNLTGDSYKRHYLELPVKARIPFILSVNLKLDYQGLIFLIGDGHFLFNCPLSRWVDDPVKPSGKPFPGVQQFCNRLPTNEFVKIKISCFEHEMQVLADDKEVFYADRLPYMRAKELPLLNETGLRIGIEVAKLSTLWIKEIELTPIAVSEPLTRKEPYCPQPAHREAEAVSDASPFGLFVSGFPEQIREEITKTDALFKELKPLKMKRSIDAGGDKLTYISSDFGISYIIRRANGESWQSFSFYIVTAGKAETWHRKADYMEEVLREISKTDRALAERIFYALNDCVGCYGTRCIVKTPYAFSGNKKLTCHGVVMLRLCSGDFADVRSFFVHLNAMLKRKSEDGTLQKEKILLLKQRQ